MLLKTRVPHVCFTAPYCYPLFNPTVQTPFGGTEVRVALIAKELARRGLFRISLVVGDHGTPHIEQRDGVTLYTLIGRPIWGIRSSPNSSSCATPGLLRRASWQVRRQLDALKAKYLKPSFLAGQVGPYLITPEMLAIYDEVKADIYVVPGNSQYSAEVEFFTKKRGKKYVFLAGSDFDYYPEYKQYPDRKDIYGVPFAIKAYAIENTDAHIVQSERQAALLRDGYGRIGTVIKNPIDLTTRFPRDPRAQNILWIGKSEERIKRPSLVLELARQLPQYPFIIILARAIDNTHAECLELAKQLPNVTLIERVPFEEIERYFSQARLHLNTSIFEGLPNTFLQAAKYGVPTISMQVDPGEMLSRHRIGMVSNGDFERFKANVEEMMTDSPLYDQLSSQALDYVRAHHDKDRIIDQYTEALQAVWNRTTKNSNGVTKMSSDPMHFGFGKNWKNYIKQHFSEERIEIARQQLLEFLQLENLNGKTFLDIGCGSGLHSLAALRAGAAQIISFDLDPDSVATTGKLKTWAGNPTHWQVMQGSILDSTFLGTLEPADIVLSWGVLHHTGDMWQAMDKMAQLIKPGGLAYLALYDYDVRLEPSSDGSPEFWLEVKQRYNRSGWWGKRWMELWYIWHFDLSGKVGNLPRLLKKTIGYKQHRGMAWYTDIVDWLGGWPMEFAKRADVERWADKTGLKIQKKITGKANIEYLFQKPQQTTQTEGKSRMVHEVSLEREYNRILGYCQKEGMNSDVMYQSARFQKGEWRSYQTLIDRLPLNLKGKVFADLGCKYGLLFPLLFQYKVKKAIGIEGLEELKQVADRIFSAEIGKERVELVMCKEGYLPLQPETVDIVFANEVISHVNPSFLPTLFLEISRILKTGGILFISDGNNLSCPGYFENKLLPLYDGLENGPDGAQVGDLTIQRCIMNQRKDIIIRRHSDLPEERVEFLAKNTCGLWGARLDEVIDHFVLTGELIRRPYRRGIAPTYPPLTWAGEVEERGFYPERVMLELMEYGFNARILDMPVRAASVGKRAILRNDRMNPATGYQGKQAYISPLPEEFSALTDSYSALVLENDQPLTMPNALHAEIAEKGMGRYSIWHGYIVLSTSDNTDPRRNGRSYELYWVKQGEDRLVFSSPGFQICALKKVDPA